MTVEEICKWLEASKFKDGARLPSVRTVAERFSTSTCTVFRAYRKLIEAKKAYGEHGNGYFWGAAKVAVPEPLVHEQVVERLERLLQEDWKSGRFSTDAPLPTIKELCMQYETSVGSMRRTLEKLRAEGILARRGRGRFYFRTVQAQKAKEILLVMRSNPTGDFYCLGDRELEFMQKVYAEAEKRELRVHVLGYHEDSGKFLDSAGKAVLPETFRDAFGAILSTMLVFKPNRLFMLFARTRFPISVWWEHPLSEIPRALKKEPRYAFFNLAFGEFPGRSVGRFLRERGCMNVAYISPYHLSSWSVDRLNGLKKSGLHVFEAVDAERASPFEFSKEPPAFFEEVVARLAASAPQDVDAWVVVNDEVGCALHRMFLRGELARPPYVVSFDNTVDSYRIRLDSFKFNLDTLAEQSVFHIVSPGVTLYARDDFRELSGRVVEK
ncbi:GntR family transcriptional regulator [Fibrobacter sp. UWR2]|uniref:GntR family transcriptional regulator n=1 Tax=Fibrobacter sp. UWR2 TaxID=1964352 RepID=UPI000B5278D0|nr:GntR family transcriptional regulator [Fibrobacter sp. UWR2]OWV00740.1 Crp/Fnr family transcriptional regulator [Fibrobacter sp. UWR2]